MKSIFKKEFENQSNDKLDIDGSTNLEVKLMEMTRELLSRAKEPRQVHIWLLPLAFLVAAVFQYLQM